MAVPSNSVEDIDKALARYYLAMGRDDYNNAFASWCNEHGLDDDDITADDDYFDFNNAADSPLADFLDDHTDFPWNTKIAAEPDSHKMHFIKLLSEIKKDKLYEFTEERNEHKPLNVTAEIYRSVSDDDIAKVNAEHAAQCLTIFNTEMRDDVSVNKLLAVGDKMKAPYLQYVADLYSRDRVAIFLQQGKAIEVQEWSQMNKHCKQIQASIGKSALQEISHAVTSFYYRIVPKLILAASTEIQDSLQQTAKYIAAQIDFVHNTAAANQLSCPFQFDACIAFNEVKYKENIANVDEESDDDDEDDDQYDDVKQDDKTFADCFGNVKEKLGAEKCLHRAAALDGDEKKTASQKPANTASGTGRAGTLMRAFKIHFDAFKSEEIKKKYKGQEYEQYPRLHRMCALVDRREQNQQKGSRQEDELIFFEPPNDCNSMPGANHVPLWYFDASKTCIIPNRGYNQKAKDTEPADSNVKPDETNITSGFHCKGALLVLSFHVISVDEIRAYLYLNGQVCRFLPQDIIELLPRYFVQSESNVKWAKSAAAKELVAMLKHKLVDKKFEAFLNEFQYKT